MALTRVSAEKYPSKLIEYASQFIGIGSNQLMDHRPKRPPLQLIDRGNWLNRTSTVVAMEEYRWLYKGSPCYGTTAGELFDCEEHAAMAYLIWRRMGRSDEATGAAWRRLMQSNCPTHDVMALVAHHVYKQCDMDQLKTT